MSKRGRGGSQSSVGVRAVASALGIARHEMKDFTQVRREAMETYPPLAHHPLVLERTTDLGFMIDVKHELLQRFRESPFYHAKSGKKDVRRYMETCRSKQKETFEPHFDRLPAELNWRKANTEKKLAKRRKLDDEIVRKKLERLAQREKEPQNESGSEKNESDDEDEEGKKGNNDEEEGEPMSDDDYLEEDNDYVQSYFDNGDAEGSDDNADDGYD